MSCRPLNRNKTAQNFRMRQRNGFRMTQSLGARTLLNRLRSDNECARMATWRSGYAAVCKADRFSCKISAHSVKTGKSAPRFVNGLAPISEWNAPR